MNIMKVYLAIISFLSSKSLICGPYRRCHHQCLKLRIQHIKLPVQSCKITTPLVCPIQANAQRPAPQLRQAPPSVPLGLGMPQEPRAMQQHKWAWTAAWWNHPSRSAGRRHCTSTNRSARWAVPGLSILCCLDQDCKLLSSSKVFMPFKDGIMCCHKQHQQKSCCENLPHLRWLVLASKAQALCLPLLGPEACAVPRRTCASRRKSDTSPGSSSLRQGHG